MTIYGYARTSTTHQNLQPQLNELLEYNEMKEDNIFQEQLSAKTTDRPKLNQLLQTVKAGDIIVVTKIDRIARNTKHMLGLIDDLNKKNIGLVILNMGGQKVDTTTPIGKLLITMLSGIAEFERELMLERQREGIALAKEKGMYKGRKPKAKGQVQQAIELWQTKNYTIKEIENRTNVSKSILYREIEKRSLKRGS